MMKPTESDTNRSINMTLLYDARASEISHFIKIIEKREKQCTKTPMQRVPKHLRRRAMAHNRYRIPSRIRAISMAKAGVSEDKSLKCRKHLRNSKLLMLHYFKRSLKNANKNQLDDNTEEKDSSDNGLWLETHYWHAKRMRMFKYYGRNIAKKNFTKCMKGCYKLSKFKSVLYDRSWYCTYLITLNDVKDFKKILWNRFKNIGEGGKYYKQFACEDVSGQFYGSFQIVKQAVGDIQIIKNIGKLELTVVFHPGAKPVIEKTFSKYQIKDLSDMMNIFEITGPHSLICLKNALKRDMVQEDVNSKNFSELEQLAYDPLYYKPGFAQMMKIEFDSNVRSQRSPFANSLYEKNQELEEFFAKYPNFDNPETQEQLFNQFFSTFTESEENSTLGMYDYMTRFKIGRRGRHTHKKAHLPKQYAFGTAPKYDKPWKKKMKEEKDATKAKIALEEAEQAKLALEQKENKGDKMEEEIIPTTNGNSLLAYIRQRELLPFDILVSNISIFTNKFRRIRIMCPLGKGKKLFERLGVHTALAVGKTELDYTMNQFGIKVYPQDFPNSTAFASYEDNMEKNLKLVESKRPGRKRDNYEKLKSPNPFRFDYGTYLNSSNSNAMEEENTLEPPQKNKYVALQEVRVEMLKKATPVKYSYLCFPSLEDFKSLKIEFKKRNLVLNTIMNNKSEQEDKVMSIKDDIGERTIIGRFSHGFFTYEKGKGSGRAYLSQEHYKKLQEITKAFLAIKPNHFKMPHGGQALALVKKVNSVYYHFCVLYDMNQGSKKGFQLMDDKKRLITDLKRQIFSSTTIESNTNLNSGTFSKSEIYEKSPPPPYSTPNSLVSLFNHKSSRIRKLSILNFITALYQDDNSSIVDLINKYPKRIEIEKQLIFIMGSHDLQGFLDKTFRKIAKKQVDSFVQQKYQAQKDKNNPSKNSLTLFPPELNHNRKRSKYPSVNHQVFSMEETDYDKFIQQTSKQYIFFAKLTGGKIMKAKSIKLTRAINFIKQKKYHKLPDPDDSIIWISWSNGSKQGSQQDDQSNYRLSQALSFTSIESETIMSSIMNKSFTENRSMNNTSPTEKGFFLSPQLGPSQDKRVDRNNKCTLRSMIKAKHETKYKSNFGSGQRNRRNSYTIQVNRKEMCESSIDSPVAKDPKMPKSNFLPLKILSRKKKKKYVELVFGEESKTQQKKPSSFMKYKNSQRGFSYQSLSSSSSEKHRLIRKPSIQDNSVHLLNGFDQGNIGGKVQRKKRSRSQQITTQHNNFRLTTKSKTKQPK